MIKRHKPLMESVWAEWERKKRAAKRRATGVQELGLSGLRELAEGGNPFAIAALGRLER